MAKGTADRARRSSARSRTAVAETARRPRVSSVGTSAGANRPSVEMRAARLVAEHTARSWPSEPFAVGTTPPRAPAPRGLVGAVVLILVAAALAATIILAFGAF